MGAETRGGSGMQELMPERGRDIRQDTVPAQPSLQFELMEYFCGCSAARVWEGGQGQALVLAGTCRRRWSCQCRSRCHKAQGVMLPGNQPGAE